MGCNYSKNVWHVQANLSDHRQSSTSYMHSFWWRNKLLPGKELNMTMEVCSYFRLTTDVNFQIECSLDGTMLQCNLPILLWPVIKWFTATFMLPSIVLPVQRLGFNGDIFPPWGLQGKLWLIIPSPCIFHLHYITLLYHNTFLYGLICK